ncbi:MAG: FtsQ-type POTRA domain-containing protein [Candidatus Eremiobacteraeota bacterium]|nr:FtsQ-type POTRA domain-containing protein [Candidatus Eremiobacteraeota bacterium]
MKNRPSRKKTSTASHVRPFWIPILFLLGAAAGAGYYGATWPGLYPKHVALSGNRVVPASEIFSKAAILPHQNIWLQNARAASARIERIPYILNASIHRTPPANVRIVVSERMPFANVQTGQQTLLVDRAMRVLEIQGRADLPVFRLKGVPEVQPGTFLRDAHAARLRGDYDALFAGHVIVTQMQFDRFDDLAVALRGGTKVLLGDDRDLAKKIPLVGPILAQVARAGRPIAAIDLRAPATPVVVYRR